MQQEIEKLMERNQEHAILARRPYPPVNLPKVNSQLGGLPILPSQDSWPRTSEGIPLHFLARIDCSELPAVRGLQSKGPMLQFLARLLPRLNRSDRRELLPQRGVLQFFGRIDEDMVWDGTPSEYSRVLYTDSGIGAGVSPPADLPPIGGGWHDYDREMRLPDEPKTCVYPQWPLTFEAIRSWPRDPKIDPDSGITRIAYRDAVERARAAEIVRTTGWPTNPLLSPNWGETLITGEGKRIVTLPGKDHGPADFPQAWIIAERVARAIACVAAAEIGKLKKQLCGGKPAKPGTDPESLLADMEVLAAQASAWVRRAQSAGLDSAVGESDCTEYREWLTALSRDERFEIAYLLMRALEAGMSYAVKYCGGSRAAASLVPVGYMNCLEGEHCLTQPDTYGIVVEVPQRRFSVTHHQMLGHAPASQDVGERSAKDVLLLHLVSDRGVDFLFCDCGEIQFWIDEDSLLARRFEAARANTQGG
jgi:uncharacterized protein YwqG